MGIYRAGNMGVGDYGLRTPTTTKTQATTIFVAIKVKAYGCSGEDPEVTVLKVGTREACLVACQKARDSISKFIGVTMEGSAREGWYGVDADEDTAYIVELHSVTQR